jgi:flavoprotein
MTKPKIPRAIKLAHAILDEKCTKTTRENASYELVRLYKLNEMLYETMNKSWTAQSMTKQQITHSMNILGQAISKSRECL